MHRAITLALAVYSFFLIRLNLPRLPPRIATHFNAAGEPNGWSNPDSLWMMLLVQVLTSALLLAVPFIGRRFPQVVNLGLRRLSDYTPAQRERVMPLLNEMMGYMSIFFGVFFVFLIRAIIRAAMSPQPRLQMLWLVGLLLAGNVLVVFYYVRRINSAANDVGVSALRIP